MNPSAKLPVSFPKSEADLPHPALPGPPPGSAKTAEPQSGPPFDINYTEGLKVGYKWFEAEKKEPLFPFGFGLSYTSYSYSALKTTPGQEPTVSFSVKNTGKSTGAEIAQVYVLLPPRAGEPFKRLVAWQKVELSPGASKAVTLNLDPQYLSIFNVDKDAFELVPGDYKVYVGSSSSNTPLAATLQIAR